MSSVLHATFRLPAKLGEPWNIERSITVDWEKCWGPDGEGAYVVTEVILRPGQVVAESKELAVFPTKPNPQTNLRAAFRFAGNEAIKHWFENET